MHAIKNTLFYIFFFFCLTNCNKDEPSPPEPPTPPVVTTPTTDSLGLCLFTGMDMVDENGQAIGSVGNPNVRSGQNYLYPKPSGGVASIYTQSTLKNVYFVKGEKDTSLAHLDFSTLLADHSFDKDSILSQSNLSLMAPQTANFQINLSTMEPGYYRVFFETNTDSIFWDNTYINPSVFSNESIQLVLDDWK